MNLIGLTRDGLRERERFLNARNTLEALLSYGVIPIINENDVVAVDEIKFGDNDNLSGLVANFNTSRCSQPETLGHIRNS